MMRFASKAKLTWTFFNEHKTRPLAATRPVSTHMALGSIWARARSRPIFLRQFSAYMIGLATWVPAVIWFNTNVAEVTMIDGPSMYPFLNGDMNQTLRRDLVLNYKLYAQDNLARGMVVTFRYDAPCLAFSFNSWARH